MLPWSEFFQALKHNWRADSNPLIAAPGQTSPTPKPGSEVVLLA